MVDAHAHLLGLGQSLRNVNLVGAKSYDEVIARVADAAKGLPDGQWILGRGWDQNEWGDTRFPTHEALSRARCRTIRCGSRAWTDTRGSPTPPPCARRA